MRKIDKYSLEIFEILYDEYCQLSEDYGIYSNIICVFFHELMKYFTNYIILVYDNNKEQYAETIDFPMINEEYCKKPFPLEFNMTAEKNNKKNIIDSLLKTITYFGNTKITIDKSLISYLGNYIMINIFKYKFSLLNDNKVFIKDMCTQVQKLEEVAIKIGNKYNINNLNIFTKNIIDYVKLYCTEKQVDINNNILIVGSNSILFNRISSANYLYNGKKVISLAHGGVVDFIIYNEPIFGYGEFSYCNYYMSFGSNNLLPNQYSKPLKGHNPKILKYNSSIIKNMYNKKKEIKNYITESMRGLYIPTAFSKNRRYGPFRDMNDNNYKRWQDTIMNLHIDITYKEHPSAMVSKTGYDKIKYENLKDILSDFDYYIIDYLSTASTLVMATNKPVFYFDLGLRNMQNEYMVDLKKRVYYKKIDFSLNLNSQINNSFSDYKNYKYTNSVTEKYSLSSKSLERILDSIIND